MEGGVKGLLTETPPSYYQTRSVSAGGGKINKEKLPQTDGTKCQRTTLNTKLC